MAADFLGGAVLGPGVSACSGGLGNDGVARQDEHVRCEVPVADAFSADYFADEAGEGGVLRGA